MAAILCGSFLAGWILGRLLRTRGGSSPPPPGRKPPTPVGPPATAAPGYRRVYLHSASAVAECGGPCEAGPEYCDCGQLWWDVPVKPKFPPPQVIPGDTP